MSTSSSQAENVASPDEKPAPSGRVVVMDLGKKSRKRVNRLRRGEGKLMARVEDQIEALREQGELADGHDVVVVVVEREPKGLLRELGLT